MKRLLIFYAFLFIGFCVSAQSEHKQSLSADNQQKTDKPISDSLNNKRVSESGTVRRSIRKKMIMAKDTLAPSDFMMSIDRVNDELNIVRDSSALGFEIVRMGRRVDEIANDIIIIRKNVRGRSSTFSIKNQYLYQNFISDLNK
jgi:hypothetical protein